MHIGITSQLGIPITPVYRLIGQVFVWNHSFFNVDYGSFSEARHNYSSARKVSLTASQAAVLSVSYVEISRSEMVFQRPGSTLTGRPRELSRRLSSARNGRSKFSKFIYINTI